MTDSDDQGPVFSHQEYSSRVTSGSMVSAVQTSKSEQARTLLTTLTQDPGTVLDISPDTVHAVDQDSLRAEVEYQLHCTALYCPILYCTVLYCTVLYCTVLYCTGSCGSDTITSLHAKHPTLHPADDI